MPRLSNWSSLIIANPIFPLLSTKTFLCINWEFLKKVIAIESPFFLFNSGPISSKKPTVVESTATILSYVCNPAFFACEVSLSSKPPIITGIRGTIRSLRFPFFSTNCSIRFTGRSRFIFLPSLSNKTVFPNNIFEGISLKYFTESPFTAIILSPFLRPMSYIKLSVTQIPFVALAIGNFLSPHVNNIMA